MITLKYQLNYLMNIVLILKCGRVTDVTDGVFWIWKLRARSYKYKYEI